MTTPEFEHRIVADKIRRAARPPHESVELSAADSRKLATNYRDNKTHYRAVAQECLGRGDHRQAAEKSWGAFAQAVKSASADRGYRLTSHAAVIRVAYSLTELVRQWDPAAADRLRHGLSAAEVLHQHFYEAHLQVEFVRSLAAEVEDAVQLLDRLFAPTAPASSNGLGKTAP